MLARVIHIASPRKDGPFVAFNAAALSPTLVESELFGHEKGAFTGADRRRDGRFAQAEGGTLFIDEIGDIPPPMQSKFLRVLQENTFERLGGSTSITVDIRIVAATSRNLESMIREGQFREDLYFRLNVISIRIPPLRDRREDILPLLEHFLKRFREENGKSIEGFTRDALDALLRYAYPGNVRELENVVEHAVVVARSTQIVPEDLPQHVRHPEVALAANGDPGLDGQVEHLERRLIRDALEASGGNQSAAAHSLGISERKLRYKIRKYRLSP